MNPVEIAQQYFDGWNRRDADAVLVTFGPDGTAWRVPIIEENASAGKSESLAVDKSAPSDWACLPTPMLRIPARRAASMPARASSTTMQPWGSAPRREAATRNTCGSGLPAWTSSAETHA